MGCIFYKSGKGSKTGHFAGTYFAIARGIQPIYLQEKAVFKAKPSACKTAYL
jgi:hypothetical protein